MMLCVMGKSQINNLVSGKVFSFGKVFLVQKKDTKKVYAMKSLRKDVILEYD